MNQAGTHVFQTHEMRGLVEVVVQTHPNNTISRITKDRKERVQQKI